MRGTGHASKAKASRIASRKAAVKAAAFVETLEPRQFLSTYYVSPAGSDTAAGTAITAAWKSIDRVNSQVLKPGDNVLFEGGKTFSGGLYLPSGEAGASTNRITFSTYGSGRAIINSGSKTGLDVAQGAGVNVSNLKFVGNGMYNNTAWGIYFHVDQANKNVSGVNITQCEASGYGREGVRFVAGGENSSINDVTVTYTDSHDNLWGGLKANTHRISGMKNYIIDHVRVWNNYGEKAKTGVSGNGIMLEGIAGGRISYSVAHDNGKDGTAPVGIWAAMGERITIEHCESYNNNTATSTDGGGFDFDWDVKNSLMQYNYSHNNSGPGYILAAGSHYNTGNTIRYNISENDGRENGRAGMQIWGNVTNCNIYNNVVYITPTSNSNTAGFYAHDGGGVPKPKNLNIFNNVFYTTGGTKILNISNGVAATAGSLNFSGNCYYSSNGAFKIQWGATSYASLADWRTAKGQEMSPAAPAAILAAASIGSATSTITGSISGVVFSDANKSGLLDTGDTNLANRKIYLDANANGKLDSGETSVFSNASGVYTFADLAAGTYRIGRADLPTGYYLSNPASGFHTITLAAGQTLTGMDIGAAMGTPGGSTTGSISGVVFSDANKNSVLDAGDTNLANRKIYLDANANGKLDSGETSVYSNASGIYTFSNLAAGSYRIARADLPAGYYLSTAPSGFHTIALTAGQNVIAADIGAATGTPGGGGDPGGATGFQGDPMFNAVGNGGTFGDADKLKNLTAYKLQAGSPLINRGVTQPGTLLAATVDFWGDTLPKGGKYDIGVDEVA